MIIDPQYGPQFDRRDGTVGKTQLVLRYALMHPPDHWDGGPWVWPAHQGRYTFPTEAEAEAHLALVRSANSLERFPELKTLRVEPVWSWPRHFDPCGTVKERV